MKVHFIAIGGSIMHQLAIALKRKGYQVTGSDDEIFEPATSNLAKEGILPASTGWHPEKIHVALDAIILGMHARADNEELKKAKALGLKIYSFPEYIFKESTKKLRVVVGGSHGKTTTTSMIMHVLKKSGAHFDYLVGALLEGFPLSVHISDAPVIVCEGDEYPASIIEKRPKFHFLFPHIAVVTGIAWDHINVFPTFENYLEQFNIFIDNIQPGGTLIFNESDPILRNLIERHATRVKKYGYSIPPHTITNGSTEVTLEGKTETLKIFGNHNLLNVNASFMVCRELGISSKDFLKAIQDFKGASKRLELIAENDSLKVYRDFAHAPSKVKATIDAVKQQFPGKNLIVVLELHTYSSLNLEFMGEYKGTMEKADTAAVFYSGHALEVKKLPALPRRNVFDGFAKRGLTVIDNKKELEQWMLQQDYTNASLLLMSSGNYDGLDIVTFANNLVHN